MAPAAPSAFRSRAALCRPRRARVVGSDRFVRNPNCSRCCAEADASLPPSMLSEKALDLQRRAAALRALETEALRKGAELHCIPGPAQQQPAQQEQQAPPP